MENSNLITQLCDSCRSGLKVPILSRLLMATSDRSPGDSDRSTRRSARLSTKQLPSFIPTTATSVEFPFRRDDTLPNLPNLAASADAGCEFCRFLRDGILSERAGFVYGATRDETTYDVSLTLRVSWLIDPLKQGKATAATWLLQFVAESYQYWHQYEDEKRRVLPAFICWPMGSEIGHIRSIFNIPKPIAQDALAEEPLAFMKTSIDRCFSSCKHANSIDHGFLPSRLVAVTGPTLRIIYPHAGRRERLDTRYVTLSYCWGNPKQASSQLKLTSTVQKRLEAGFTIDELAPIQRDAIRVAQALSIPFIWIDALCIMQDNRQDWEQESATMDRIYASSYVTICILTSNSCQDGFIERPNHPGRIRLPYDPTTAASGESYELGHGAIYEDPAISSWNESDLESNAWNTRGWTFQEKLMSTRRLYFGNAGLHFSCSNRLSSEYSGVEQEPQSLMLHNILNLRNPSSLYQAWYNHIAKPYSTRRLTYLPDTLSAISGLARHFARLTADQYVAGLWRQDLLHGLFWVLHHSAHDSLANLVESIIHSPLYIAPSWSWVGRGQLSFFLRGRRDLLSRLTAQRAQLECDDLWANSTPGGYDEFGAISEGILTLETRVCPLELGQYVWEPQSADTHIGDYHLERPGQPTKTFSCYLDWEPRVTGTEAWAREITMALVGNVKKDPSDSSNNSPVNSPMLAEPFGLLLYPTTVAARYIRVGLFGPTAQRLGDNQERLRLEDFMSYAKQSITVI